MPGLMVLNWSSLGISDFIKSFDKAVYSFAGIAKSLRAASEGIIDIVEDIRAVKLLDPSVVEQRIKAGDALDLAEFFELIDNTRQEVAESLVRKYLTMQPLLVKVEEIVVGTSTGKAEIMQDLYAHWERRVYSSLTTLIIQAMKDLTNLLCINKRSAQESLPLFKVYAHTNPPEITITPPLTEIRKTIARILNNIVESTKLFVRWQRNTCNLCPSIKVSGDEEERFTYSFYQDISENPEVLKAMLAVNQGIQKTFSAVSTHSERFKKYFVLWKDDRNSVTEKFAKMHP